MHTADVRHVSKGCRGTTTKLLAFILEECSELENVGSVLAQFDITIPFLLRPTRFPR